MSISLLFNSKFKTFNFSILKCSFFQFKLQGHCILKFSFSFENFRTTYLDFNFSVHTCISNFRLFLFCKIYKVNNLKVKVLLSVKMKVVQLSSMRVYIDEAVSIYELFVKGMNSLAENIVCKKT